MSPDTSALDASAELHRVKANSKLFGLMDHEGLERLAGIAEPIKFEPGAVILREGELGDTFYLLIRGGVRVTLASGQEVARLGGGAFFGEMAMLNNEPRTATVTAIGKVECWCFSKQPVLAILQDYPKARELLGMTGLKRAEALLDADRDE